MLKRYIGLYAEYIRLNLIRISHNKRESIIGGVSWFVLQFCGLVSVLVILDKFGQVPFWSLNEMGMLYAGTCFARALSMLFADGVWNISGIIQYGELDQFLTRPAPPLLQLFGQRFEMAGLGNLAFSVAAFLFFYVNAGLSFGFLQFVLLALHLICGALLLSALFMIFNSIAFWIMNGHDLANVALTIIDFIAKMPITIFPRIFQWIFSWVFPIAFISFFPVGIFLGKETSPALWLAPFLVCAAAWGIALFIWHRGLRTYGSTGS